MGLASLIVPAVSPAVGAMLAGALDGGEPEIPGTGNAALDGQAALAETEMRDPSFWEAPPPDWQRDAVALGIGTLMGLIAASQIFGR